MGEWSVKDYVDGWVDGCVDEVVVPAQDGLADTDVGVNLPVGGAHVGQIALDVNYTAALRIALRTDVVARDDLGHIADHGHG